MSLVGCESFDGVTTVAQLTDAKTCFITSGTLVVGRTDQGLNLASGGEFNFCFGGTGAYPGGDSTVIVTMALRVSSLAADTPRIKLREGQDDSSDWHHLRVEGLATGAIRIVRANGVGTGNPGETTLETSAAGVLSAATWHVIEIKALISDSVGTWLVKVDGVTQLSGTGDTFNNGGTPGFGVVDTLTIGATSSTTIIDDMCFIDSRGSDVNDLIVGTVSNYAVRAISPNGNGSLSEGTGSDGNQLNNYALVDEPGQDDTDYVAFDTDEQADAYTFENLAVAGTVRGVQVTYRRAWDTIRHRAAPIVVLGATETEGESRLAPTTTGDYQEPARPHVFEIKPGGGTWTVSDVNAAEFGVRRKN